MGEQQFLKLPFEFECEVDGCYLHAEEIWQINDADYDLEAHPLYEFSLVCEEPGMRSSGVEVLSTIRCCGYTFTKREWPGTDGYECWECKDIDITEELEEALDEASPMSDIPSEYDELYNLSYPTLEAVRREINGENRDFFVHDGIVGFRTDTSVPLPEGFERITIDEAARLLFEDNAFV